MALVVLHNWLEGVLQHHWRKRWGFQKAQPLLRGTKRKFEELDEGDWEDTDSGDDLDEDRWHAEFDLQHGTQATLFSEAEKKWIQKALEEVVVPSGTSSVPKDLGDVRHGKLKDNEWRSLFMYIIPLVVMDLLVLDVDNLKSNST
ncbi:hypothetical protein Pst134EB_004277 [Puccinia striiformis f. sp. tritici]|nr:hypothetical protein Pst134EB_004277 [Puccinia striiformis f. sp. tritici]